MFDTSILDERGRELLAQYLGSTYHEPDLTIAPDGNPYLYRWYVTPHDQKSANVYLHVQVASDPERPLHDHPWDNMSVILRGGYDELIVATRDQRGGPHTYGLVHRKEGDVVFRKAKDAHRLILPAGVPYTMTLFTTGPKTREWGFWTQTGWRSYKELVVVEAGVSKMKETE